MLESLVTNYGYLALIVGTFFEGETIMVLAGVAAHIGYLSLDWVIICGFGGSLFGDQLYFMLGRHRGKSMLVRHPSWQQRADKVIARLEKHQNLLIVSFRFLYGLRTVTPFIIGMSQVAQLRFTLLNIIGAGIWAISMGFAGFYLGQSVEKILGDIKKYELEFFGLIVILALILWIVHFLRNRAK